MALCTTAELVTLTGTTYSTDILNGIIAESDRTIKTWLSFAGLSLPDSDDDLKNASLKLSIGGILTRMRLDGTKPAQLRIGDLSVSDDIETAITNLTTKAREHTQAYIKSHGSDDRARYYLRKVNA